MSFVLSEDEALKNLFAGMTVSDDKQPERPVDVFYAIPDVEIRQQRYPYITIDLVDIRPANERQTSGYMFDKDYLGTIPAQEDTVYTYYMPVAYDLVYQVSSWSRHPRHDRALLQQMLRNRLPAKYGKLAVPNDLGTETAQRSMFLDAFAKINYVEDGRRVFRNLFTVRIVSEMTPAQADSVSDKIVEKVVINGITGDIPSSLNPV